MRPEYLENIELRCAGTRKWKRIGERKSLFPADRNIHRSTMRAGCDHLTEREQNAGLADVAAFSSRLEELAIIEGPGATDEEMDFVAHAPGDVQALCEEVRRCWKKAEALEASNRGLREVANTLTASASLAETKLRNIRAGWSQIVEALGDG